MAGDYGRAQILCRQSKTFLSNEPRRTALSRNPHYSHFPTSTVLILEPRNKTVLEFRALLEQKLQMGREIKAAGEASTFVLNLLFVAFHRQRPTKRGGGGGRGGRRCRELDVR